MKQLSSRLFKLNSLSKKKFSLLQLPKIPYEYSDLEPVLSKELVEIHHAKHHNAYVTNYNNLFPQLQEAVKSGNTEKIISLGSALKFNGGSHINHSIYWTNLAPIKNGGGVVSVKDSPLRQKLDSSFGSMEKFQEFFTNRTIGIQGSGWGWLVYNKVTDSLEYKELPNQDPVCMFPELIPIFTVDVWEHAYYISYKNMRANYVKDIWKLVNWKNLEERYLQAKNNHKTI